MVKSKYEWRNRTNDYCKKHGEEVYTLTLFEGKKEKLPLLNSQGTIATHEFEITAFDPKPYNRPYRTEKISEDEETVTSKKIFLSDYKGNIDTEFFVRYVGWLDTESRAFAYFLNGEMKEAYDSYGKQIENPEAFRKYLTEYFKGVKPTVGKHLNELIINSNLPKKQKDAVRDLWR